MKLRCRNLVRACKSRSGFTLIEMLIVIIILGILAMVIIPQITVSTEDAKVSTLKANLTAMRSAIEVYYAQHNMTYPGVNLNTAAAGVITLTANAAEAKTAFLAQLTLFTDANGKTAATKDTTTYKFGPYIKGGSLPDNPFKDNDVVCDLGITTLPVTRAVSGTAGWQYLPLLGIFFANDAAAHLSY